MPNLYVDLRTMKVWLHELDRATQDDRILLLLEDVCRQIDNWTHHKFYVEVATRYLTAKDYGYLLLPPGTDLLAVTSLKTDDAGDRSYGTTWAAADYDLEPEDAPTSSPPKPYWKICTTPHGRYGFPTCSRGIALTGKFGFYEVLERSSSLTAEALDDTETLVTVDDGEQFSVGHTILIDDEQMYVSGVLEETLTVTRGVNGTTAAAHLDDAPIDVYTYPGIREAVRLQFNRLSSRRDSPMGSMGSAEFGVLRLSARLDPDVQTILAGGFRMRAIG